MSSYQIVFGVLGIFATIVMGILSLAVASLTGALKSIREDIKATAGDLANHRENVARDYVTRDAVDKDLAELEQRLVTRVDRLELWLGKQFDSVFAVLRDHPKH